MNLKLSALFILLFAPNAVAATSVQMSLVDSTGSTAAVGHVTITQSKYGVVFSPSLSGLAPGLHGFHLHQNPSCDPGEKDGQAVAALAAGGHYDPRNSNRHDSPWGAGHLGDLPPLFVDAQGNASQPVLAPRLKLKDLSGRSLIIHLGGDNHSDHPAPLGGGGARMACGVVQAS